MCLRLGLCIAQPAEARTFKKHDALQLGTLAANVQSEAAV